MIRVAHVVETYLPRTQTFVFNQIAALETEEGVVLTEGVEHPEEFPVRVPIVDVRRRRIWRLVAVQVAHLRARFALGAHPLPFSSSRIAREVKARGVGLLHAHFGHVGYACLPARKRARVPLATSFYGFDAGALARDEAWRRRLLELFAAAELFVAEGPAMRDRLVDLGCTPGKVRVVPIGIDISKYRYGERQPPGPLQPVRLLFVGRMVEKKGLELLLRAFAELRRRGVKAELDIVGDGPLRDRARSVVDDLGIGEEVHFWGMQSHVITLELLQRAHILVQPSLTASDGDTEGGAPTIVLEAQATGLPVIASRHADLPNITRPELSAILCDEGNQEHLTRAVQELSTSPHRWGEMGRRGREFVVSRHDAKLIHRELQDAYMSVLGGPRE